MASGRDDWLESNMGFCSPKGYSESCSLTNTIYTEMLAALPTCHTHCKLAVLDEDNNMETRTFQNQHQTNRNIE